MLHGVYIFDADNTLWNTHDLFVGAYKDLIKTLINLGYIIDNHATKAIKQIDLTIAELLNHNYEYDYTLLAYAIIKMSLGLSPKEAALAALKTTKNDLEWEHALKASGEYYLSLNSTPPKVYPGTYEVLEKLKALNNILILHSEGKPERINKTLETYDMAKYFHGILIEKKSPDSFQKAKELGKNIYYSLTGIQAPNIIVVGDSPARDIMPGNTLGAVTILKPGGLWGNKPIENPLEQPNYIINNLTELL